MIHEVRQKSLKALLHKQAGNFPNKESVWVRFERDRDRGRLVNYPG